MLPTTNPTPIPHAMELESTGAYGVEVWKCNICGRRISIIWQPFKRTVLNEGNNLFAGHTISKGGLSISVQIK